MSRWLLANYLSVSNLDALRAPSIVWLVYYSGARSRFNLESSAFPRFYRLGPSINDVRGSFTNHVDKILAFFDHLPSFVDIFYGMNVHKKRTFLDHLPNSSCERSL